MNDFAIIFDMDGVIADTGDMHERAWFAYCKKHNIRITSELFRTKLFGRSNTETFQILLNREITAQELMDLVDEKETLFRTLAKGNLKPTNGLTALLSEASQNQIPMCVASSAPAINVDFVLKETGTIDYFSHFTSADEVIHSKPNPDIFLLAANKLGYPPEKCLVFEDSFAGIEAAERANMKLITVASTHQKAALPPEHLSINDFTEIDIHTIHKMFN